MKAITTLLSCACIWLTSIAIAQPKTYYVHGQASGANDGSSWTNAFNSLQAGIDAAATGDSVWVAAGTYFPTAKFNGDSARNATFYINKDILLFGGFAGTPGTEGSFDERQVTLHPTILSGDIGLVNDSSDNVFHVVYIDHVSDTMRLDGFIIEHGNTLGAAGFDAYGGGIFNNGRLTRSNPIIANCIIRNNDATESAGGIMNFAETGGEGNMLLISCRIEQNNANGGGGMQNYADDGGEVSPVFVNTYLRGNTIRNAQGSAMSTIVHSGTSEMRMINSIVSGNHSDFNAAVDFFVTGTGRAAPVILSSVFTGNTGGAIRVSDLGQQQSTLIMRNSIFAFNPSSPGVSVNGATEDVAYSIYPFSSGGEGVIGLSPLFVDPPVNYPTPHVLGDVRLLPDSPGLDAGRNSDLPLFIFTDAAGNPRIINSTGTAEATIDIGAFEYQDVISSIRDEVVSLAWQVSPNPAIDQIVLDLKEAADFHAFLFDMNGTLMREFTLPGNTISRVDIHELPQGMYTIMAVDDTRVASIRLVKQ